MKLNARAYVVGAVVRQWGWLVSAEATFWAWMMGVKPASAKLTLLCLADCHNSDSQRCDPSVAHIASFSGLDRKTVMGALQLLESLGLISSQKRKGTSPQYRLLIAENPPPERQPGEKRKPVPINHRPKNGPSKKRDAPCADIGVRDSQISEYKPTENLPATDKNASVPDCTAENAAPSVDNSLPALGVAYDSVEGSKPIFDLGTRLLTRSGAADSSARSFLAKLLAEHGEGALMDALLTCLLEVPLEPKSYLRGILKNRGREIPLDWRPGTACLGELAGLGVPDDIVRDARDVFVIWFRERGIPHPRWDELFTRWCVQDWERAEFSVQAMRQRLAQSAGIQVEAWREPA